MSNLINEKLYDELVNQNVYKVSDIYNSDSSIEIEINSVEDNSNIYSASDDSYEVVKQWKLQVAVKMSWYDIKSSQIILEKKFKNGHCMITQVLMLALMVLIMILMD